MNFKRDFKNSPAHASHFSAPQSTLAWHAAHRRTGIYFIQCTPGACKYEAVLGTQEPLPEECALQVETANYFCKGQRVSTIGLAGHMVSVTVLTL